MKLINTNRTFLKGTNNSFMHLATIQNNCREYICIADCFSNQVYIEEITGGHLQFIEDESLVQELNDFLVLNKVLLMDKPLVPDSIWHNLNKPSE